MDHADRYQKQTFGGLSPWHTFPYAVGFPLREKIKASSYTQGHDNALPLAHAQAQNPGRFILHDRVPLLAVTYWVRKSPRLMHKEQHAHFESFN
jgi:hypothetical protein